MAGKGGERGFGLKFHAKRPVERGVSGRKKSSHTTRIRLKEKGILYGIQF